MASKALGEITGETIEEPPHPLVGTEAPPFSLPDMYGRTVTNADFKDKVAVLQIGTTW